MANIRKEKRQERIRERKARRAARRGIELPEETLQEQEGDFAESEAADRTEGNEAEQKGESEEVKTGQENPAETEETKENPEETAQAEGKQEIITEAEEYPTESSDTAEEPTESGETEEIPEKTVVDTAEEPAESEKREEIPEKSEMATAEEPAESMETEETPDESVKAEAVSTESAETAEEETESAESVAAAEQLSKTEDHMQESAGTPENLEESADFKEEEKNGFFRRLVRGLTKTRQNIIRGFDSIFSGHSSIDDDFYEDLEEVLIMGDVGIHATEEILDKLREKVKENNIKEPADCREYLMNSIKEQMSIGETAYRFEHEKAVILVIGVNGVGKTTTIGKLAGKFRKDGKKVVLAAADTFRAAAAEQLTEWAHRAGVDIVSGQEGSDPGSVVYDACQAAKSRNADILLCDTAGRLHNKKNLMAELEKIGRILEKEYPDVYRETLVVLDATTGQNALNQARQFNEVTDITGVVLTKMDGTAKGGIAVAIQSELGIPVKYIGVGESIDDLQKFNSDRFVDALFDSGDE